MGVSPTASRAATRAAPSYFPNPFSSQPLDPSLRNGLYGPGLFGLLSVLSCTALITFIVWRFVAWRRHYKTYIGYNQYVVLILNLLLADLQQGIGFLISFHWAHKDAILAPTRACFAQGWLINIGDVSSGLFVFFIAVHTYFCAVKGRRLEYGPFAISIVCTWCLALLLTALGPAVYKDKYFVRAGAWCWASAEYETERLLFHYLWVFMIEFGTVMIYAVVLFHLRKTMILLTPTAGQSPTYAKVDRAAKFMVLYPAVYIVLTLPLSAGRMWSMAHHGASLSTSYSCVSGTLIASSGFFDAILYTLTRRALISSNSPGAPSNAHNATSDGLGWFKKESIHSTSKLRSSHSSWIPPSAVVPGITQTRTVTVSGKRASSATRSTKNSSEDREELQPINNNNNRPAVPFASMPPQRGYNYRSHTQQMQPPNRRDSTDRILARTCQPMITAHGRQFEHYAQGSETEVAGSTSPTGVARSSSKKIQRQGVSVTAWESEHSDESTRQSEESEDASIYRQDHERHEEDDSMRTFFRR